MNLLPALVMLFMGIAYLKLERKYYLLLSKYENFLKDNEDEEQN